METSLQLLTKLLVSKFYIWQGERSQTIIFRSLGWVAQWCWWSCKVLFKHAWHPVRNIDHNICMPLQMLGGCLFDLQAVGGWQYHFFSSFVCAGCSWTDITTRTVLQSTPAHTCELKHGRTQQDANTCECELNLATHLYYFAREEEGYFRQQLIFCM